MEISPAESLEARPFAPIYAENLKNMLVHEPRNVVYFPGFIAVSGGAPRTRLPFIKRMLQT